MIFLPVTLFALAAINGATLVILNNTEKGIPLPLVISHGILAAAGLVTLILNVAQDTSFILRNISLIIFLVIAVGGFILLSIFLRKKPLPNLLIAVHGLGAIVAFVILLITIF